MVEYSLNHTPCTHEVQMASYFEVEAMVRGYHQYKEIWEAEVGKQLKCQREASNPHNIFAIHVRINGRGWLNLW